MTTSPNEGETLFLVLCVFALVSVLVGYLIWKNRSQFGFGPKGFQMNQFTPPPARAAYIEAREKLDPSKPDELNDLRKMLMSRALQTIPIILNLQSEGSSVDRLYRKGMLTDDLHERLQIHKAFVDAEIVEVQQEAEELNPGWDKHIWPQAMQYHNMLSQKQKQEAAEAELSAEEKRKIEKERRKAKSQKVQAETAAMLQETPEQRADRIAQELIEEEEREKNKRTLKKKN